MNVIKLQCQLTFEIKVQPTKRKRKKKETKTDRQSTDRLYNP